LFGIAAVITMQLAGRLAARLGSSAIVRLATVTLPVVLIGVGLAGNFAQLAAVMLVVGAVHGLLDVTMNAHAVAVERALKRPIMNGCHAAWSIGAVAGSLAGGAAAQAGLSLARHYLLLCVVLVAVALLVGRSLLHDNLGAPLGLASLGYIAFTACETTGRLVGDRLFARFPARVLVRLGTLIAAVGLTMVVLSPWPVLAIAGFAVMGIGLATPLPVLFSVVGHIGADGPGAANLVARFTTMTYSGILVGPALIGALAQAIGLTWTLAAPIPLLAYVAYHATAATRPE
jgi:predicted MFS family arabinose efflux permease